MKYTITRHYGGHAATTDLPTKRSLWCVLAMLLRDLASGETIRLTITRK